MLVEKMKLPKPTWTDLANFITYIVLLFFPFLALYYLEWYSAIVFAGILVFFTIFLSIGDELLELSWGLGGFYLKRRLRKAMNAGKEYVKEAGEKPVPEKVEKEVIRTLQTIRADTLIPDYTREFLNLWWTTENTLVKIGKEAGLPDIERTNVNLIILDLQRRNILDKSLINALNNFRDFRNFVAHGYSLDMEEYNAGRELGTTILAQLIKILENQKSRAKEGH
jgi:hypothetical protein